MWRDNWGSTKHSDQHAKEGSLALAGNHAACDVLDLEAFNEDDLYANLDWLCEKQEVIEKRLFKRLENETQDGVFLYDVTSSYLEGMENGFFSQRCG